MLIVINSGLQEPGVCYISIYIILYFLKNCFKLTNLEIRGSQLFQVEELALVSLDP